ncbi:competence protein ComK [Bacillus solitudinis]|uniref:competence protein ComK n=1 Tax=Bacillus solitudinis TaxID=2014074 RepID=UPI0012FDA268|nr:competence protein ComK [Bacillus solitudinis]
MWPEMYEVNESTMALVSIANVQYRTMVIERETVIYREESPLSIIKHSCLINGSSYEGRIAAVKYLTGISLKTPVAINPDQGIYAFPTHSPKKFECNWIFLKHVNLIKEKEQKAVVVLSNSHEVEVGSSYFTIEKQLQRTAYCAVRC